MAIGCRLRLKRLVKLVLLSFCAFSVWSLLMRRYRSLSDPFQGLTQIKKSWMNSLSKLEIMASKQEARIVEAVAVVEREWAWVPKAAPAPKEATPVPKKAAPVPKETAPVPKKAAPAPKKSTPVPKKAAPAPKKAAPAPKEATPVPKKAAPVPKETAPVPKKAAPAPKEATPVPKKAAPVPKETAPVPKKAAPVPKEATPVPKTAAPVPKETAPVPKKAAPAPKEAAPAPKEAAPVPKKATPVPKKAAPVPKETAPVPKKAAPKEATPVPKRAAPAPKEAAPKETAPVKKEAAPVQKDEAPAINRQVQATTPKTPTRTKATVRTPWLNTAPAYPDPSYSGDQYAQDDNPFLSTGCPNSIRQRILASDFRLFYLPKIPIFQWAKHAMPEEFERLRWYNGCFGWNVTSWNYTKEVLSLLNTSANGYMFTDWNRKLTSVSPCIRCAVVGNGGILNGSKVGREIDQHDYVFRVNGAVLNGHEADVGNRTSFYFFSTNTMINSLYSYAREGFRHIPQSEKTSYIFIPDNDRDYFMMKAILTHSPVERGQDMLVRPSIYFGENYTAEQFKLLHPDFLRYLRNRFLPSARLRQSNRDIYRPSSGAAMLLAAIHSCDEVSAYGFITPDYEKYSDHYYDLKKQKMTFYANHDFLIERDLWQRLHQQGIIKLYSRT